LGARLVIFHHDWCPRGDLHYLHAQRATLLESGGVRHAAVDRLTRRVVQRVMRGTGNRSPPPGSSPSIRSARVGLVEHYDAHAEQVQHVLLLFPAHPGQAQLGALGQAGDAMARDSLACSSTRMACTRSRLDHERGQVALDTLHDLPHQVGVEASADGLAGRAHLGPPRSPICASSSVTRSVSPAAV
jgi:hypothetical protein